MKKSLLLLSIPFIIFSFTSCKKTEADKRISYYKDCAKAEVAIELMRKNKKPDWKSIKEKYNVCLNLVKEIDNKYKTNYQAEIQEAIIKCNKNENIKVNQQILAKGLQHVVVMKIRDLITSMGAVDKKLRENNVKEIAALFEGIRPTFIRRDKDYFEGRKQLEAEADKAINVLLKSVDSDYVTAATALENSINKTYALCVLFEMQAIEKLQATDIKKCDVKKAEAIIFYRIIEDKMKKTDREANKRALAIINAEYSAVNSEILIALLNKGLGMKIL